MSLNLVKPSVFKIGETYDFDNFKAECLSIENQVMGKNKAEIEITTFSTNLDLLSGNQSAYLLHKHASSKPKKPSKIKTITGSYCDGVTSPNCFNNGCDTKITPKNSTLSNLRNSKAT